jgi:hypothetical protein
METVAVYESGFYKLKVRKYEDRHIIYVYSTFLVQDDEEAELIWSEHIIGTETPSMDAVKYAILQGHIKRAGHMIDHMKLSQ